MKGVRKYSILNLKWFFVLSRYYDLQNIKERFYITGVINR